jgi:uncharacterized protein (DUF885 family)
MRATRLIGAILAATLLAAVQTPGAAPGAGESSIDALGERYWQHELQTNYYLRLELGKPILNIRPISYANAQADAQFSQSILDGLKAIDQSTLDHDHWLTYRTLSYLATVDVATGKYFWLQQQATPYAGGSNIAGIQSIFTTYTFKNAGDAQIYNLLLRQYAAFVRSIGAVLKEQHKRGIILPNVESDAAAAVFAGYAQPAVSGALVPSASRMAALAPADRQALRDVASGIVSESVVPAFTGVANYLKGAYQVGAPSGVGLSQYPGGAKYYRYLVFQYTTLSTTPEKLHAMGVQAVARLNQTLAGIQKEVGFTGSLAQFKHYLATNPRFFVKTPEQFGARLEMFAQRSYAAAPGYFLHLPKTPFGVEPLPKALAGSQTFGYYDQATAGRQKGLYLYNAWHPERTSALGAGALICHELIPGHHFQISLQQEDTALPNVRHYDFSETGFVEGWGEYSSQLCWMMGVYQTPYDRAGRVMQDLMVSTRLVVDTGMNSMGWSRERAMQFMRDNLTLNESQIETESLRYSTDIPGQALAYKTGELTMLAIRAQAQAKLGKAFDIRQFHSWIIDSGTMTLDTLREHVEYEIANTPLR